MPNVASPSPAPFGDGAAIVRDALRAFLPPERVTVSDYAAVHRWLDNRGGGYVGRWNHDEAPYLCGPMDAVTSPDHLTTVVVGPTRSGKTAVAENWLLQSVGADPADMLFYQATDDALQSYVKRVINPMIESHPELSGRLGPLPIDRSIHFKKFRGMWCEFLHAAYSNLINKSAPRIVLDEIDAVPETVGDVFSLADMRRQTFGAESMVLVTSHPDRPDGVMRLYRASDQRRWYWPCPQCNGFSSPNPGALWETALHYRPDAPLDEIAASTVLVCPHCDHPIEDRHRRAMNLDGKWVGRGQSIAEDGTVTGKLVASDKAGFWIVGVMSPFVIGGIGALARFKVAAEREFALNGDESLLRSDFPKRLGIPYERKQRLGSVDAATLAERAEDDLRLGVVPPGVRFITVAIDVQSARFELLARGWGIDGESWVIDARRVRADTAVSPGDWDELLQLAFAGYPLSDGSGRVMRPRVVGYDSGGAPGVTQQAYAAWRRARARRMARYLGRVDGRDNFTLMPMKGLSTPNAARLQVVYPNSRRKDRDARATGAEPLVLFNPNRFKDDLAGQLLKAQAGPLAVHFPRALCGNFPAEPPHAEPPHLWFEQVTAEQPNKRGAWEKLRDNAPNEALDLMVASHVVAELHGLSRIVWSKPPAWAAEWDRNSGIAANAQAARSPRQATATEPAPHVPGMAVVAHIPPAAVARPVAASSRFAQMV